MNVIPGTAPPVVFIAQMGTGGDSWRPVIDRLHTGPTTVTYDRPGTGEAPPRPVPNPPLPYSAFARELADLLDQNTITDPVVLVGHSVGSLIARAFAGAYPQRVAGMVHVDGSIPRLNLVHHGGEPVDGDGPDATMFDTVVGEAEILEAPLPKVPTAVLTRTPGRWDVAIPHPAIDRIWSAHQRILAERSSAPLVVAVDAGHQIPAEAPALLVYVVDAVVRAAGSGGPVELDEQELARAGGRLL